MESLSERLKAGIFAARLFNDPFQFESEDRRIGLADVYDIGYLICAPVITDFLFWFRERVQHYGIKNIWWRKRRIPVTETVSNVRGRCRDGVFPYVPDGGDQGGDDG